MKKKSLNLSKKLILSKDTIATLGLSQQNNVKGGGISDAQACPPTLQASCNATCKMTECNQCPPITNSPIVTNPCLCA